MKFASLFTGIGGFDLGLERAGHEVVFQCESLAYRQGVLARHWPGVPFSNDIVGTSIPQVEMICGGFPCQDISVAGRQEGIHGENSSLFFELARIADESIQDGGWVLLENVSNLLASNDGRDFIVVIRTLAELGFHDLAWRVFNSESFGVPQRRRRVFILARRASGDSARQVLLEPESSARNHRAVGEEGALAAAAARSATQETGRLVTQSLTTRFGNTGIDLRDAEANFIVSFDTRQLPLTPRTGTAPTLTTKDGVSVSDGDMLRRLTPTECERLQGFPDGWTIQNGPSLRYAPSWYQLDELDPEPMDPKPDGPRYAAVGDAVTVPVAEWIGNRLNRL